MLAALDNGVKGSKWYSMMDKVYSSQTLRAAWLKVASNGGAAGVDRMSTQRFGVKADQYLRELEVDLQKGTYQPEAVRRVHIPKGPGQTRPLGIPTVKDRVVQTAMKMVLEPIFEREFLSMSYGFRPGRGCKDALREVDQLVKAGFVWVVDADLKSYFDSIPHTHLIDRVKEKVSDGRILDLLESFIEQDIMDGLECWKPVSGTPQGAVISPLLSNLYLHPLDRLMTESGYKMVRYADDFVVLCRSKDEAEAALGQVCAWTEGNGLNLHPEKTHLGNCLDKGQGFDFLGYRFECGRRFVRKKSLKALADKIRMKTERSRSGSLRDIIGELNPMLRGWFAYFKHAIVGTFRDIDGFVRRRLRALLRRRKNKPGQGHCYADHRQWPNAFFAQRGLFTMHEAFAVARQSRCGNH
ncbi:MAG: group II intron reverse transcriptase/maturase [Magnetococcales bacterium]|nr:group II intron reverse transcriptase/maturase [Magnetococcales bacterium]